VRASPEGYSGVQLMAVVNKEILKDFGDHLIITGVWSRWSRTTTRTCRSC
jgi:hypothetical protein